MWHRKSLRLNPGMRFALCGALALLALSGCGSTSASATGPEQPLIAKDANNTPIVIPIQAPRRIVSLTPGDSEILAAVGVTARVIAVDYYTNFPPAMAAKPRISDGQSLHVEVEKIISLSPDLVLSYGGETAQDDQTLIAAHIQVVDLPLSNLAGTLTEMRLVGQLVHGETSANTLVDALQKRITTVEQRVAAEPPVTTYMESDDTDPTHPYVVGGGTFDDDLIKDAGGSNIFESNASNQGFPQVSAEAIIAANPQVILLTEDPQYGGNPALVYQRKGWSVMSAVQNHRVFLLDSDSVQRPGPRLIDTLEQIASLLHPNLSGQ
jgi:iron complex transport system substrate-binding protein